MSIKDRETLYAKLEEANAYLETIAKNNEMLSDLDEAIKYLSGEKKVVSLPHPRDEKTMYREKVTDKIEAYDKAHKPVKHKFGMFFFGCVITIIMSVVFFVSLMIPYTEDDSWSLAKDWAEISSSEQMAFIAICIPFVVIPLIYIIYKFYAVLCYDKRVAKYFNNNPEREKELAALEENAKKDISAAQKRYMQKMGEYKRQIAKNAEVDEKILPYEQKKKEYSKELQNTSLKLAALFDELNTPKEYRNDEHLQLLRLFVLADTMKIDSDELTVAESLQNAYNIFKKSDEENEIKMLAERQRNREIERARREKESKLNAEIAETSRKQEEFKQRMEEEDRKRFQYLNDIMENQ